MLFKVWQNASYDFRKGSNSWQIRMKRFSSLVKFRHFAMQLNSPNRKTSSILHKYPLNNTGKKEQQIKF